ncbi:MAG TPA: AraC family transcriptional regulator [Ilumatobacteraceae bacterium]|nr:AraC family transcriptional regulator [Ilumatobacteraceae bacterium]
MADIDRLDALLEHFRVRTRLFHTGSLCGVTHFPAQPGRGFLHVFRRGDMDVAHHDADGTLRRQRVDRPSLIFCPRAVDHSFDNAPDDDSDFACATFDIDGGATHPLLDALAPLVVVPLDTAGDLDQALGLLFAEIDRVRCGNRVLADRLFEVLLIQLFRWLLDHPDQLSVPAGLLAGLAEPRLARALTAIHESPGTPWTLSSMASRAGMSRSTFAAQFKQLVGQTPAAYLTGWRITLAQAQLRAGNSVTRTAFDLGYATAPAFTRAFTARLGCSPRAWLKTTGTDVSGAGTPAA